MASWQIISHKGLRFLSPFFAILALIAAGWAAVNGQTWAMIVWGAFLPFGILGLLASVFNASSYGLRIFRPIGFALIINAAAIAAWLRFFSGHQDATWDPTKRT
jgi:hypothetical protein